MKYRHVINLLWISIPICVLLRVIQIMFTLDDTTGFIKQQYSQISIMISFVVCAAILAVSLLANATEDIAKNEKSTQPLTAIACLLTSGMFVYETVASVSMLSLGSWHGTALIVLGLLSAVTFVAYGVKNVYDYRFPSIVLVIPVVYYVIKLINLFVSASSLALVTNNVFMIFSNSALLLFMFEFASFESGVKDGSKAAKMLFASGVALIMLCAVTALPQLILAILQKSEILKGDVASSLLMITQAIFAFAYIDGNFYKKKAKAQKPVSKHSA